MLEKFPLIYVIIYVVYKKRGAFMEFDVSKFQGTDSLYETLSGEESYKLVRDLKDLDADERAKIRELKEKIVQSELLDLGIEDISGDISLLMNNIPDNLTPLQKVRWVYVHLGRLFSYDYRIANDSRYGDAKNISLSSFIGRYQSCVQISNIMFLLLNSIDGVTCNVIERKLPYQLKNITLQHVANEVILQDYDYELKILLDLTLDLYLIQADCMTRHFGFEDDGSGTYDIIPLSNVREMDRDLGLYQEDGYTDDVIKKIKTDIHFDENLSDKENIEYRLSLINQVVRKFPGYHEGKQYVGMLFHDLLQLPYSEYNLFYREENEINLKTVYHITFGDAEKWIIYSNSVGFISTSREKIQEMLLHGWFTNSLSLESVLESDSIF